MAVFRIEKTRDYTVMANHHLRNTALSLKAKGLLSLMQWQAEVPLQSVLTSGHIGAVDKVASENQQWEFEQKKRRSLASFRVPYHPLQVQSGR